MSFYYFTIIIIVGVAVVGAVDLFSSGGTGKIIRNIRHKSQAKSEPNSSYRKDSATGFICLLLPGACVCISVCVDCGRVIKTRHVYSTASCSCSASASTNTGDRNNKKILVVFCTKGENLLCYIIIIICAFASSSLTTNTQDLLLVFTVHACVRVYVRHMNNTLQQWANGGKMKLHFLIGFSFSSGTQKMHKNQLKEMTTPKKVILCVVPTAMTAGRCQCCLGVSVNCGMDEEAWLPGCHSKNNLCENFNCKTFYYVASTMSLRVTARKISRKSDLREWRPGTEKAIFRN